MKPITWTVRLGVLAAIAGAPGGCGTARVAEVTPEPFPVEAYARQRSETVQRLVQVSKEFVPRLRTGSPEERARAMKEAAAFVGEHFGPHAEQTKLLYAYADREQGGRYTETMQWEHRSLGSDIRFLESLAGAPEPDVELFRKQLDSFLDHMWWHIDKETDTIAAPVVDNELERRRQAEREALAARSHAG